MTHHKTTITLVKYGLMKVSRQSIPSLRLVNTTFTFNLFNKTIHIYREENTRLGSHVKVLTVMQDMGCFELDYVKSLMKSQSHETRSSMILTVHI